MIAITGATGQLGHYVIKSLMKTVPASQIVAIVRNPAKAQALTAQGITVRQADYGDEAALTSALQGVEKLLLISSSEVGQRAPQHRNVINAAKTAGVKFIAYTSLLHADKSPLGLADEHIETEKMLADSGIVYTLLRNGWYTENYLASAPAALEHGVFIGAAGDGKIASATRADYAAAAARVISEADKYAVLQCCRGAGEIVFGVPAVAQQGVNDARISQHFLRLDVLIGEAERRFIRVKQTGISDKFHASRLCGINNITMLRGTLTHFAGRDQQ